jgi:hypothetical protein
MALVLKYYGLLIKGFEGKGYLSQKTLNTIK